MRVNSRSNREVPEFDELVDVLQFAAGNDMGHALDASEEISDDEFEAERRRRRRAWAAMPRAQRKTLALGQAVRERLLLIGMKQAELARNLGKDRAWVTRLVQGRENITIVTLSQLAEALGCDERDLLCDPDPVNAMSVTAPLRHTPRLVKRDTTAPGAGSTTATMVRTRRRQSARSTVKVGPKPAGRK